MRNKMMRVVLGAILLIIGGGLAAAGAVVAVVSGPDDTMRTGYHPVTTSSRALVAPAANISPGAIPTAFGEFSIQVDTRSSDKPVFIGVAPAAAVDGYLSGAAADTIRGLELWPYRLHAVAGQGSASPAAPQSQSFWVASASGTSPRLRWHVTDGNYRVVIMNTDASAGLASDARFALTMPWLFEIGLGTLVLGAPIAVAGLVLLVRSPRRTAQPAPPWADAAGQNHRTTVSAAKDAR
jgi:hypothetical protein